VTEFRTFLTSISYSASVAIIFHAHEYHARDERGSSVTLLLQHNPESHPPQISAGLVSVSFRPDPAGTNGGKGGALGGERSVYRRRRGVHGGFHAADAGAFDCFDAPNILHILPRYGSVYT
jgi:hypothetical protein